MSDGWAGHASLNGGKGYAATPLGQVHYRDIGPRDAATVVLLHQTPMSMIEFAAVQPALAACGLRSVAIDTPGYGMSDHPAVAPDIAGFADAVVAVLDALGIATAAIAGHHTGAFVAADLAARHPARTGAVVLHGLAVLDDAERAARLAVPAWDRTPHADMRHFAHPTRFRERQAAGRPLDEAELEAATWMAVGLFMQSEDTGHPACFRHDLRGALAAIRAPGLVLADRRDGIFDHTLAAAALRPDFECQVFSERNHEALMVEPDRWAAVVADFLARAGRGGHA